ncbi:MAG: glucosylceramidase [Verrucomicrobia bacterium]|nr:glucosylceramidase [Verrucomicrobiota bacterium]
MKEDGCVEVTSTCQGTGDRLARKTSVPFSLDKPEIEGMLINVHAAVTFQTVEGFGGAFTESGAETLGRMPAKKREEIINAYFNTVAGLGYNLCRTHINSCDFSLGNYALAEKSGDVALESFSISRDERALIPFILEAQKMSGGKLKILASPWSPPAWMKTNGMMNKGGKLKPEYAGVWAEYYSRYIKAYAGRGIEIWAVSVQNEPKAVQSWDSCVYTAEEERDFVKHHLGPSLQRNGLGHVKIVIWDHNKERVFERSCVAYCDPDAARYIWGTGFHWYSGDHFEGLQATRKMFPDKHLLFTEGCQEGGVKLGAWAPAERYGHDIIGNLNNDTEGFIDWNLVLDEQGGPNHVGNFCDAPVIADTRTGEVTYEASFYYLGHFSRFIRPGAVRIGFSRYTDRLEVTAFRNPDGVIAVVVMNRTADEIPFVLRCHERGTASFKSKPHSIVTLRYA